MIRRTGASLGFNSIDETITPSRKSKVSGFSSIFSKVGRKRTKPPTPLSLRTSASNSNLNQCKETLLSSPIISSPVNTPRHTVLREQSYFTVPRLERPPSRQGSESGSNPTPSSLSTYSSAFSNFNRTIDETSPGLKMRMDSHPSPLWSTKSHFSGISESGNTTPRGNTFPPRIHSSQKNYHQQQPEFCYPRRDNKYEEDESYFPPSPFQPSRIPLPSTPSETSLYGLELTTPPRTYSDNLLSTPIISIRRPSIPDSPPISIHQPKRIVKKETKPASFSSSFQSIEPSSLLSRSSHDLGTSSGWTGMLLEEVGRSETSGTLNEFDQEFEFPWFIIEGSSEESGKRKSIFDFGIKEGTSMKLRLEVKKKKKGKPSKALGEYRCSFFSTITGTSSGTSFSDSSEEEDVNSEDTSHNRPFHYLTSMLALESNNPPPLPINTDNGKERVNPSNPSNLISAPSRAYVPLPRSPGLQTLRLVGSSSSLNGMNSSSTPNLKRTASQDRHQSDPNQYSKTVSTSISSDNSNIVDGGEGEEKLELPSVWPRRPSFESSYASAEEEVIHSTTLPLSVPNRSLPPSPKSSVKSMESIAVQTDLSFPSFTSKFDGNLTPPPTRSRSIAPTSTFLSPIDFRTNNNLEIPSPSSSLNVNYYSSAPSSPKFESALTTLSSPVEEKDPASSFPLVDRVLSPSNYSSNSNSSNGTAMLFNPLHKSIQTPIRPDTASPQSIPSSPENLPTTPIRPPRSHKRVQNESMSSITTTMMIDEHNTLMTEAWMREGRELRERNAALEFEVERLKRVVG